MSHDNSQPSEFTPDEASSRQVEQWQSDPENKDSRSEHSSHSGMGRHRESDQGGHGGVQPDEAVEGEVMDDSIQREIQEAVFQMVSHSGPLPPASEFAAYENVLKGSADRILAMAELSADAAAEATKADAAATRAAADSILEDGKAVKRGQIIFAVISILLIIAAIVLAFMGQPTTAYVTGGAGIVVGLAALITPVNKERWRPQAPSNNSPK